MALFGIRENDAVSLHGKDLFSADLARLKPEEDRLLDFVELMTDLGVRVQMIETIAMNLPPNCGDTPVELLDSALEDVAGEEDEEIVLDRIIIGAASLEFLVRYAGRIPNIIPRDRVPTSTAVATCLRLFHAGYGN